MDELCGYRNVIGDCYINVHQANAKFVYLILITTPMVGIHRVLLFKFRKMICLFWDSSQMEINRLGLNIHFMIHLGDIHLQRNNQHEVTEVLPPSPMLNGEFSEAPIYIEVDRQTDPVVLETLKSNLLRVLADVSVVVKD